MGFALGSELARIITNNQKPVTIVVVDDHPVVRDGLCAMISTESNVQVVGEAATQRAEFQLGEPTKQNAGERRVRLGRTPGRQAQQRPRESEAEKGTRVCVGNRATGRGFLGATENLPHSGRAHNVPANR